MCNKKFIQTSVFYIQNLILTVGRVIKGVSGCCRRSGPPSWKLSSCVPSRTMVSPSTSSRICLCWSPQETAGRAPSSTESSPPSGKTKTQKTWQQVPHIEFVFFLMFFALVYCNAVKIRVDRQILTGGTTAAFSITQWQPDANDSNFWGELTHELSWLATFFHPNSASSSFLSGLNLERRIYGTNSSTAVFRINQHTED